MPRPYELDPATLEERIEEMVNVTFADLQSQFLVLPKGEGFIPYPAFQDAYEVLKRHTTSFARLSPESVWSALEEDSLSFLVLRTILGLSPPEWAELARSEQGSDVDQGAARGNDRMVRTDRAYMSRVKADNGLTLRRVEALIDVAVEKILRGAPSVAANTVHRLDKEDTSRGLDSLRFVASVHVPYPVLLYERYLGRPFASHRDAVSGLVGDIMENAVEDRLAHASITYQKTRRAERVLGFEQAPDFFVPTTSAASVIIEAKITSDDGTARDKVARILRLGAMRDQRLREGQPAFQVVACIDGRGFGVRRNDMRDILRVTQGKVFTLATLDHLVGNTNLQRFVSAAKQ